MANTSPIDDVTFDGWVREHQRLLFRIAFWWTSSRSDAEDLVQETFLEAYRGRSGLRDRELVRAWLIGILRNRYRKLQRQPRTETLTTVLEEELIAPHTLSEDYLALHQALRELDDRHRLPVVLFYFEELSYKEIGIALGIPLGTVMSRLSRARRHLLDKLQPQNVHRVALGVIANEL